MAKSGDLVACIEAGYDLTKSFEDWLQGICEAAQPLLDRGQGVFAYTWDVRNPNVPPGVSSVVLCGCPPEYAEMPQAMSLGLDRRFIRRAYLTSPPVFASSELNRQWGYTWETWLRAASPGVGDCNMVGARCPDGIGLAVGVPLARSEGVSRTDRRIWTRVAAHWAAAFRLRTAVDLSHGLVHTAETIFRSDGRCVHAEADSKSPAIRSALAQAVLASERARGALRRAAPGEALEIWKGLVDGRWSLIDQFDSDGRRHILAIRNTATTANCDQILSERERQVAAYAALGHPLKFIAYELGLSPKTVSFHLKNAMLKLRVSTRAELACRFPTSTLAADSAGSSV